MAAVSGATDPVDKQSQQKTKRVEETDSAVPNAKRHTGPSTAKTLDVEGPRLPPPGMGWRHGGRVTLTRVPYVKRNDSGNVLHALQTDGFALLPGFASISDIRTMRQGDPKQGWKGVDSLVMQCNKPDGTKDIKTIINRNGGRTERWESRWDWGGRKMLGRLGHEGLARHAPELSDRKVATQWSSVVLTRQFTKPQRWHMDFVGYQEKMDLNKIGIEGDWLLMFLILYGKEGKEGAGPDICPFWPSKWLSKKAGDRPTEMWWTRPALSPGDAVIVRGSMLHRGGGGMDRGVGFIPFYPAKGKMNWGSDPFQAPWLPEENGIIINEVDNVADKVTMP